MGYNTHKKNGTTPAPYVHQDYPAVFYGPDNAKVIVNGPLEVPEGWHDSPRKVGDPKARTTVPGLEEALAGGGESPSLVSDEDEEEIKKGDDELGLPAYDDITAAQLEAALDKEGVAYKSSDDKYTLYLAFRAVLSEA